MIDHEDFIRRHFGQDMTPGEIASHLGIKIGRVVSIAKGMSVGEQTWTPTAVHTPVDSFKVAVGVRRATLSDAYPGRAWQDWITRA